MSWGDFDIADHRLRITIGESDTTEPHDLHIKLYFTEGYPPDLIAEAARLAAETQWMRAQRKALTGRPTTRHKHTPTDTFHVKHPA